MPTNKLIQFDDGKHGRIARVAVLKQTRVAIALRRPTSIALPDGPTAISEIHLYVDNPRRFVAAAREQLAARTTAASPHTPAHPHVRGVPDAAAEGLTT